MSNRDPGASRGPIVHELPARDDEAEAQVIGSALLVPSIVRELSRRLRPEDFYGTHARAIWRAMTSMADEMPMPDLGILADRLTGQLGDIDPVEVLAAFLSRVSTACYVDHWADRVAERSLQRRIAAAGRLLTSAESFTEAQERARTLASQLADLAEGIRDRDPVAQVGPGAVRVFERVERIVASGKPERGLQTGLPDLDEITGGMRPEELIILAARPSVGKSALALTLALNVARQGTPVQIESLEMGERQVMTRLLSLSSRVPAARIRDGDLEEADWPGLVAAAGELQQLPIRACFDPGRTLGEISASARRGVEAHGVGLLVVDYLGLVQPDAPGENRRLEVETASRGIKRLARKLKIPVVVLAQLNRAQDARSKAERRPRLSDLRETGQIEADADQVWLLDRPVMAGPDSDDEDRADPSQATVYVAKNREGETGECALRYRASLTRFECEVREGKSRSWSDHAIPRGERE
jgi:replicative DNA helicase